MMYAMATKAHITCHVLDTTSGRPAKDLNVLLKCTGLPDFEFTGTTNNDGRIMHWAHTLGTKSIKELIAQDLEQQSSTPRSIWQLTFNTGDYYGLDKTFWPVVQLSFIVTADQHYHVPLLLGPFSYTTYRGS